MPGYTATLDKRVLEHVTGKTTLAAQTPFVALFTTNPTDASGAGAVETTYTNYTRVACSGATWATATGTTSGSITTATAVSFPACGTTGATIVGWGIYDANTAGTLLFYGTSSLAVSNGITPQFAAGQLTLTLS